MNKHKYGNYVLLNAEFGDTSFVNDFKVFLNLNKEVMKYMIIKLDEKPSVDTSKEENSTESQTQEES